MANYDLSFLDNTTSVLEVFQGVNNQAGQWLGGGFLIFLFLTLYISFSQFEAKNAFLGSSFITALVAGGLFGAAMIPAWALAMPVVLTLVALFVKLWSEQ